MLKLKEFYEKIPEVFKNKYFIVGFLFLIWISFLDENNLAVASISCSAPKYKIINDKKYLLKILRLI